MQTKFDPHNAVIKLCMDGLNLEDSGRAEDAAAIFYQARQAATDDYERFIAAYHWARQQKSGPDKLQWMETSLRCAQNINDDNVMSAYATLYLHIAQCYEDLGDFEQAQRNYELANSHQGAPSDQGPFYHGTKADLPLGALLTAGQNSNYQAELKMNHIYFTANLNGAGLAAALAQGEGRERVYIVEPTGAFEHDPNLTDKKLPGNLTRSYRSQEPLRIIGEETAWVKPTITERLKWNENLAENKGEIIN
ncbi:MAG: NAD(+)--rifampin ADP-ribosyltransferase [Gracilibacteraceae bacterium]|jgi:rifampin ADP-ribosylating transferase|nr:NAD(+)--rifampin ADP-ribosyltransferase [Gracilibacteraceae bacterium]